MKLKGIHKNDLFFESHPTAMWIYDPTELSILKVNKAALKLYGYNRHEMLSLSLSDLWSSTQIPDEIKRDGINNKSAFHDTGVWEHLDREGNRLRIRISIALYGEDEKKYRLMSAQNVSHLKKVEHTNKYRAAQQQVSAELGLKALKLNDIQTLFEETSRIVADTLDNEFCKILQYFPEQDYFLLRSGVGWNEGLVGKTKVGSREQSHSGYALLHKKPIVVEDLEKEERFTDEFLLDEHHVKSGIAIVIPGSKKPYGVLATHSSRKKEFTDNDVIFVTTVANILAAALERMSTENLAQKQARQQAVIAELGRKAVKSDNLKAIFDQATRIVAKTLGNEFSKVLQLLDGEDTFLFRSGTGYDKDIIGSTKVDGREGSHAGFTLLSDAPVVVEDLEKETRFAGSELLKKHNVRSGISVVIRGREKPYGILETHSTEKKRYSEDEIVFVETVAHFLGDTIERIRAKDNYKRLNRELEQKVQRRTEELELANKELEAFSYNVSHDLRAPLRAISGYTNLLLEDHYEDMDREGKEFLEIINDETQRMGTLIDDLLSFSRMNRKEQNPQYFDMQLLVDECVGMMEQANPEIACYFEVEDLPEVYADRNLVRQVWLNLLGNAVKYRKADQGPEIGIHCKMDEEDARYIFSVEDNGVGFDMKYADKLFGVFERLHSDDEFEGTGIGLALVQRIIHRHGGQVWAESELDKGTTMYFSLPVKQKTEGN